MPEPFTIVPPPICDDPNCLVCRTKVLFAVAKALDGRNPAPGVPATEGAIFTMAHALAEVMGAADVPEAQQFELFRRAVSMVSAQSAEAPRSTYH